MSLCADDMIFYVGNPRDTTKKLLETINKYSEVAGHKISVQKPTAVLCTHTMKFQKKK